MNQAGKLERDKQISNSKQSMQTSDERYGTGVGKPKYAAAIGAIGGKKSRNTEWANSPEGKAHYKEAGRRGLETRRRNRAERKEQ